MLRMTPEEFAGVRDRINSATQTRKTIEAPLQQKRTKYGNEITMYQGIRFDSKSEAKRFVQLQAMEKAGQISELKVQVSFDLLPAQEIDGKRERPVRYIADFTYTKKGQLVIEDVKSAPTKTKEFVLKRKMMMFFHKAIVREILMD